MIRRSARLDKNIPRNRITITLLQNMIDSVRCETGIKYRIKKIVEIVEYIIDNFDKLKQACRAEKQFEHFAKLLYNKIQGFVEEGETFLQQGEKIKMSVKKLRRYRCIYAKMYKEYQEFRLVEITTLIDKKNETMQEGLKEMRKHIKKFLINQIPLCSDVLEIVKSYCFYDKKTAETIKFVKGVKQHIVTFIDFATFSRRNGFGDFEEDSDEVEHWAFYIHRHEPMLQGVNCKTCGNYWEQHHRLAPRNILCNC